MLHTISLGTDVHGNIARINNLLQDMPERLELAQQQLEDSYKQLENAKGERDKPFPMETTLAKKSERLAILDAQLNLDAKPPEPEVTVEEVREVELDTIEHNGETIRDISGSKERAM